MTPEQASMHVSLPRAAALTDLLLSPPGPEVTAAELGRAKERVVIGLAEAFRSARTPPGLRIDAYQLQLALSAPDKLDGADRSFAPTPATCRRAIGIAAISHCLRDVALPPAQAVGEVLADSGEPTSGSEWRAWWVEWFRRLPEGAKAVVQAEATTWATQLYSALEWSRFEPQAVVGRDYRWDCTRSPRVRLHAKVDVQVQAQGRPVLFLVPTGIPGPHWSAALALSALVAGLVRGVGSVPARVVGMWPASGQLRILPVEPGTLDHASKLVVEAAWAVARAQRSASTAERVRTLSH
jgi:hypothetical protein